jgi:ATP-binding cassette, subfamily B, bacterial
MRAVSTTSDVITVMIAHRLSTVMHADRIYVLERGRVAEMGQHDELVEAKGLYYAMWRQQVGERRESSNGGAHGAGSIARAGAPVRAVAGR